MPKFLLLFFLSGCGGAISGIGGGSGGKTGIPSLPPSITISPPEADLAWDADLAVCADFRIYHGDASGSYNYVVDVGATLTATVTNLPAALVYLAATCVDSSGAESDYSNEVSVDFTGQSSSADLMVNLERLPHRSLQFNIVGVGAPKFLR